jgi:hypothetical protein
VAKNLPFQYVDYRKTTDHVRTRYGGSVAVTRKPTQADPRSVVAESRLEEDPRLRELWAGYVSKYSCEAAYSRREASSATSLEKTGSTFTTERLRGAPAEPQSPYGNMPLTLPSTLKVMSARPAAIVTNC